MDGHILVACVGHIHFVPHKDFHLESRLFREGHLLQRVRRQALDVHNLRLINLLPIPPPLHTSFTPRAGESNPSPVEWGVKVQNLLCVINLGLLLLALLLLLPLLAELLGRGDDMRI